MNSIFIADESKAGEDSYQYMNIAHLWAKRIIYIGAPWPDGVFFSGRFQKAVGSSSLLLSMTITGENVHWDWVRIACWDERVNHEGLLQWGGIKEQPGNRSRRQS